MGHLSQMSKECMIQAQACPTPKTGKINNGMLDTGDQSWDKSVTSEFPMRAKSVSKVFKTFKCQAEQSVGYRMDLCLLLKLLVDLLNGD